MWARPSGSPRIIAAHPGSDTRQRRQAGRPSKVLARDALLESFADQAAQLGVGGHRMRRWRSRRLVDRCAPPSRPMSTSPHGYLISRYAQRSYRAENGIGLRHRKDPTDTVLESRVDGCRRCCCLTVRAGHGPAAEAGEEAPPVVVVVVVVVVRVPRVVVRVPRVVVRVPRVVVRVPPAVAAGTAAVLPEVAVPRQAARPGLPSVPGSVAQA